ncbi:MAG: DUF4097 family beta strand repeat-containing protein [bacterium]|nr:DUF4097 family beta strand repeat-containing protein [bacterium]
MLKRLSQLGLVLCLAAGVAMAQKDMPPPTPKPAPTSKPGPAVKVWVPDPPRPPRYPRYDGVTTEKAIAADPNVAIQLCVSEGDVKINGSSANEVRVFVRNGRRFEFRSLEKNPETGKANWVQLARATGETPVAGPFANCLSGDSIEIEIPSRGSLAISGRSATVTVDSVYKATVKLIEGDVSVRNISGGLYARTEQGELLAESISGDIGLETTTGNIVAFDLKSSRPGEPLKISTIRGTISLQNVSHRQIDASATSGSVKYVGTFEGGGLYKLRSASGRIGLLLPADVNCKVSASYGYGNFDSSFPIKILTENVVPGGKVMVGEIGNGKGPVVNLSTTSGSIRIVKQGEADLP